VDIRQNGKRVDVNAVNRDSVLQVIFLFETSIDVLFSTSITAVGSKHNEFLIWKQFVQSSIQWSSTKGSLHSFEQIRSHFESLTKQLQQIQNDPSSSSSL
jgi:hypothetical protein